MFGEILIIFFSVIFDKTHSLTKFFRESFSLKSVFEPYLKRSFFVYLVLFFQENYKNESSRNN